MRSAILLATLLGLSGCATPSRVATVDPLIQAVAKRLELSREVAWIKYLARLPVRDAAREAEVLDRMSALAAARGLQPAFVRKFFTAQIAASCAEQEHLIRQWRNGASLPAGKPRDLRVEIRRDIDAINLSMLDALKTFRPSRNMKISAESFLQKKGFGAGTVKLAIAPL